MQNPIEALKVGFKGDVLADEDTLREYSRDASIFEVKPSVVVFPKDTEDVEHLVRFVKNNPGLSLTGRAAGTDMTGGPLTTSIVVSFTKYLNHIKAIDTDHAVVEPGVYYRDLEKVMNEKGVMYPSYPASKSLCAMGGIIANNSGGEKSLVYGQTVDHVRKLNVVLADGNTYEFKKLNKLELKAKMRKKTFEGKIYREMYTLCEKNYDLIKAAQPAVSKNSSGYLLWKVWDKNTFDLSKVFVGSQGTLGLWTEADVDLVKKNKHSRLVAVSLKNLAQINPLIDIAKKYHPESLESFDKHTLKLGLKFMPEIARKVNKNLFSFMWGFRREAFKSLLHGFPFFIVLVELTGDVEEEIQTRANLLGKELASAGISSIVMRTEEEGEKYWIMRRESFNLLRQKVKDKMATPFVDDFSVKPEFLSEFLPKLYALLKENGIEPTLAGHVGDGNFHIIPLMDLKEQAQRDKIPLVLEAFTTLVKKYGGSITAEHNDGLIRTPYLEKQFGSEMIRIFEKVKDIFDEKGVFNPGKKVRGDLAFALSHIKSK